MAVKTRSELQSEAVRTILEHHRLIVNWGTGVGKSRVAIETIDSLYIKGKRRILLFVAESAHKENWHNEFLECKGRERGEELFQSVVVECYASIKKHEGSSWDLIVADEGHHLRSNKRTVSLSTIRSDYVLILSATLSDKNDGDELIRTLIGTYGPFESLHLGVQDAIDNGILAEPKIYVHLLPLEKVKAPQQVVVGWGKPWLREEAECNWDEFQVLRQSESVMNRAYKMTVNCTALQGYQLLSEWFEMKREESEALLEEIANTLSDKKRKSLLSELRCLENEIKQYGMRRKMLLGRAKTSFAKWLIDSYLNKKKFVCFCTDIPQGQALGGENIIHSQRKGNADVIASFNKGDIRSIFAVGMIKEGQNLAGIEAGLIVQLGGKERDFVQEFGRALRSRTPEQHLIVFNDTRDVYYYKNAVGQDQIPGIDAILQKRAIDKKYIRIVRY